MAVYFISGIDTDAGKSIVTGVIARTVLQKGVHVIFRPDVSVFRKIY